MVHLNSGVVVYKIILFGSQDRSALPQVLQYYSMDFLVYVAPFWDLVRFQAFCRTFRRSDPFVLVLPSAHYAFVPFLLQCRLGFKQLLDFKLEFSCVKF